MKNQNEINDKIRNICTNGDKIIIKFDIKLKVENLITQLCNLKYTVIINDQIKTIHKRGSANYILCIYEDN